MTLLFIAFWGIITAMVMAFEGDFSGIFMIAKVLMYILIIIAFLWFLATTGWIGIFLILGVSVLIGSFASQKE